MEQNSICWCSEVTDSWGTPKRSSNAFTSDFDQPRAWSLPAYIILPSISQLLRGPAPVPRVTMFPVQKGMQCHMSHFPVASQLGEQAQNCTVNTSHAQLTWRGDAAGTSSLHLEKLLSSPSLPCVWPKGWQWPSNICTGSREAVTGYRTACSGPQGPCLLWRSDTAWQHSHHFTQTVPREQKQKTPPLGSDFLFLPGEGRRSQCLQVQAHLGDTKLGQKLHRSQ